MYVKSCSPQYTVNTQHHMSCLKSLSMLMRFISTKFCLAAYFTELYSSARLFVGGNFQYSNIYDTVIQISEQFARSQICIPGVFWMVITFLVILPMRNNNNWIFFFPKEISEVWLYFSEFLGVCSREVLTIYFP